MSHTHFTKFTSDHFSPNKRDHQTKHFIEGEKSLLYSRMSTTIRSAIGTTETESVMDQAKELFGASLNSGCTTEEEDLDQSSASLSPETSSKPNAKLFDLFNWSFADCRQLSTRTLKAGNLSSSCSSIEEAERYVSTKVRVKKISKGSKSRTHRRGSKASGGTAEDSIRDHITAITSEVQDSSPSKGVERSKGDKAKSKKHSKSSKRAGKKSERSRRRSSNETSHHEEKSNATSAACAA